MAGLYEIVGVFMVCSYSILSPISGTISRIEYKGQSNQALTAKVIIKPDLKSVTSPLTVPLPNVSPVPSFTLPSP
ncbi:MAG: hypothetical protein AB4058_06695 [Microcystaceae cyanobacterium]